MMTDPISIYTNFNYVECAIWMAVAIGLPIFIKCPTTQKKLAIGIASFGFIAFGASDFLEASSHGQIPLWLLGFKVACGAVILSGRFTYMGWKQFRVTDRYFLFGLFCLLAISGIIAMRIHFEKAAESWMK